MDKIAQARQQLSAEGRLFRFMSAGQRSTLRLFLNGEEGEHFADIINGLAERIDKMPETYQTDGQGDDAIVYLHYFGGPVDAWVTEKDMGDVAAGDYRQVQAFGLVSLGFDPELGYINIEELIGSGVELDLYWTPKPLKEVRSG